MKLLPFVVAISVLGLTACETTNMRMGGQNTSSLVSGSAAGGNQNNASSQLQRCQSPLGTIALFEDQGSSGFGTLTREYKLPPSANLLRLMIQQSNCFVVVERGKTMAAMSTERTLQGSGELRGNSKFGKGQMVASDYTLTPEVNFSSNDTGGMAGALGGLLGGGRGQILANIAGSTKTREASVLLTMIDNRSSVQIAAAEGSASKTDFGGMGSIFGTAGAGSLGGYQNTPQGKVLTAAFMDAYNNMVISIRNYKAQEVRGGLGQGGNLQVGN